MDEELERRRFPSHAQLAWPTLVVMKRLGRPVTNQEAVDLVAREVHLTPEQVRITRGRRGSRTLLDYRLAWSRTLLKGIGAIENLGPCLWKVTAIGENIQESDIKAATDA